MLQESRGPLSQVEIAAQSSPKSFVNLFLIRAYVGVSKPRTSTRRQANQGCVVPWVCSIARSHFIFDPFAQDPGVISFASEEPSVTISKEATRVEFPVAARHPFFLHPPLKVPESLLKGNAQPRTGISIHPVFKKHPQSRTIRNPNQLQVEDVQRAMLQHIDVEEIQANPRASQQAILLKKRYAPRVKLRPGAATMRAKAR